MRRNSTISMFCREHLTPTQVASADGRLASDIYMAPVSAICHNSPRDGTHLYDSAARLLTAVADAHRLISKGPTDGFCRRVIAWLRRRRRCRAGSDDRRARPGRTSPSARTCGDPHEGRRMSQQSPTASVATIRTSTSDTCRGVRRYRNLGGALLPVTMAMQH